MRSNARLDSVKTAAVNLRDRFSDIVSPPGKALKRFPAGVPLEEIGGFYLRKGPIRSRLFVDVTFRGYPKSAVPAELIPMLAIGSTYENKERTHTKKGSRKFTIKAVLDSVCDEWGVHWAVWEGVRGELVYVRMVELARFLFLGNTHLARTAFRPDGLNGLAIVNQEREEIKILMGRLSDYPIAYLRSVRARHQLAWLLLDPGAKHSFGSIFSMVVKNAVEPRQFNFEPPDLVGSTFDAFGTKIQDVSGTYFEVDEIFGVHLPSLHVDRKVVIHHPKLRETVAVKSDSSIKSESRSKDRKPDLNIGALPRLGKGLDRVDYKKFSFSFGNAPETTLAYGTEVPRGKGEPQKKNTKGEKPLKEEVGIGHAEAGGESAQELVYGMNRGNDSTVIQQPPDFVPAQATEKFEVFREVIHDLSTKTHFSQGGIKCLELPFPNNKSTIAIRTKSKRPLQFHMAEVYYDQIPFIIVEVDTDSLIISQSLSTLIIGFKDNPEQGIKEVMQLCSDSGVTWKRKKITLLSSLADYCKHPMRQLTIGGRVIVRTPEEYHRAWVALLYSRILELKQKL